MLPTTFYKNPKNPLKKFPFGLANVWSQWWCCCWWCFADRLNFFTTFLILRFSCMLGTRSNIAETEYSAFSQISVLRAKPGSLQTVFTRPKRARWVCRQTSCFLTTCHSQMAIIHCTMSFVSKQIEERSGMCSAVLCVLLNSVCLYTKAGDASPQARWWIWSSSSSNGILSSRSSTVYPAGFPSGSAVTGSLLCVSRRMTN